MCRVMILRAGAKGADTTGVCSLTFDQKRKERQAQIENHMRTSSEYKPPPQSRIFCPHLIPSPNLQADEKSPRRSENRLASRSVWRSGSIVSKISAARLHLVHFRRTCVFGHKYCSHDFDAILETNVESTFVPLEADCVLGTQLDVESRKGLRFHLFREPYTSEYNVPIFSSNNFS